MVVQGQCSGPSPVNLISFKKRKEKKEYKNKALYVGAAHNVKSRWGEMSKRLGCAANFTSDYFI